MARPQRWTALGFSFLALALLGPFIAIAISAFRNHPDHAAPAEAPRSPQPAIYRPSGMPHAFNSQSTPNEFVVRDPCIVVRIPFDGEPEPAHGMPIRECPTLRDLPADTNAETLILHVRQGILEEQRSEFPLPGSPLRSFQRVLIDRYEGAPLAFGRGGTDNVDAFLTTADNMRHLTLQRPDSSETLERQPLYLPVLLFNKWISRTSSAGDATIRWQASPERFNLQRSDGSLESYLPCTDDQFCLLAEIQDGQHRLSRIQRDAQRHLSAITSPGGASLKFLYGRDGISQIEDSAGHAISYGYDASGHLATATYPDGSRTLLAWNTENQIASLSTASGPSAPVKECMHAGYRHGMITSQTFSNGLAYSFQYGELKTGGRNVTVTLPNGSMYDVWLTSSRAVIHPHCTFCKP